MLSREDSRRLAQLERQLRHDDPEFCARMEGTELPDRPHAKRLSLALILVAVAATVAAIVLCTLAQWIPAAATAGCAVAAAATQTFRVLRRRRRARP